MSRMLNLWWKELEKSLLKAADREIIPNDWIMEPKTVGEIESGDFWLGGSSFVIKSIEERPVKYKLKIDQL